jgi:uncharacterized protein YkwD
MKNRWLSGVLTLALGVGVLLWGAGPTKSSTTATSGVAPPAKVGNEAASAASLVALINKYRRDNGLPAVPVSRWLTYVAEYHVYDLETNSPAGGSCNLHSWSNQGRWTPCCYTDDHARASCMWDKPRELSGGAYSGNGFEIATVTYGGQMTPEKALESWQGSPGHNDVILNRSTWADTRWQAMGVGISGHYAVVWFGKEYDAN